MNWLYRLLGMRAVVENGDCSYSSTNNPDTRNPSSHLIHCWATDAFHVANMLNNARQHVEKAREARDESRNLWDEEHKKHVAVLRELEDTERQRDEAREETSEILDDLDRFIRFHRNEERNVCQKCKEYVEDCVCDCDKPVFPS